MFRQTKAEIIFAVDLHYREGSGSPSRGGRVIPDGHVDLHTGSRTLGHGVMYMNTRDFFSLLHFYRSLTIQGINNSDEAQDWKCSLSKGSNEAQGLGGAGLGR